MGEGPKQAGHRGERRGSLRSFLMTRWCSGLNGGDHKRGKAFSTARQGKAAIHTKGSFFPRSTPRRSGAIESDIIPRKRGASPRESDRGRKILEGRKGKRGVLSCCQQRSFPNARAGGARRRNPETLVVASGERNGRGGGREGDHKISHACNLAPPPFSFQPGREG